MSDETVPTDADAADTASPVRIVGAGPAGLAAALTVARAGRDVSVTERRSDVGLRFHGDFQGLENWTTRGDVLDELVAVGIEPTFEATPFRECVAFDPSGAQFTFRARDPMWYLVRRGAEEGTVDYALKAQAVAAGVDLRFGQAVENLTGGGIVAHGPHRADAIAVGYVFETDAPDGAYAALGDDLAPKGYSYLLICSGRGTVASCMFADFHNEAVYLERTVDFFRDRVDVQLRNPRRFGGFGNIFPSGRARKGNLLYVGEAAGFQDALFGFGMRYALLSGHLAGRAWLEGRPARYDASWQRRLGALMRLAMVNRHLFERLGNRGYTSLMRRIDKERDARAFLHNWYTSGAFRRWLFPLVRRRMLAARRTLVQDCPAGCSCTWCRCEGHGDGGT